MSFLSKNGFSVAAEFFLILSLLGCSSYKKNNRLFPTHPLAIVQGATDKSETYITILSEAKEGPLTFVYYDVDDEKRKIKVSSFLKKISPDKSRAVEQIHIKNLDQYKSYMLTVYNKNNKSIDERSFKSLDFNKRKARIGVISCTDDHVSAATKMWTSYLNQFLDVNFMIGDNVYADRLDGGFAKTADPKQLWLRYTQTWDRLYFYHTANLSPTFYLWDDHDYGKNDGGAEYKYKKESLDIFWTFHPAGNIQDTFNKTVGAGSVFKGFGQEFIFIDARSFRENKTGSRWGKKQTDLILSRVKSSEASIIWLIQGDQFFGAYHPFESFEKDHPKDFTKILAALKKTQKKIVFVSGDRHLTEVMKIEKEQLGYTTYEITSSGMHAKVFPGSFKRHPNPRGEVGASGVFNYTVLGFDRDQVKDLKFKVTSYGAENWKHYSKEIDL